MRNIQIDPISFWIGFAIATVFWWLMRLAQPTLSKVWESVQDRFSSVRQGLKTSTEARYRQDILNIFQNQHLAGPLFSLNEIAVEPQLLLPPPPVIPGKALPPESLTDIAVPYMPDWPFVNSQFPLNRMTIPMIMSKGANLLLMGVPGSGRSFSLRLLATRTAQRHPDVGFLGNLIPVLIHAGELDLEKTEEDPMNVLYKVYANKVSMLVEAQLPDFLNTIFEKELCLLLVDGLDEVLPEKRQQVIDYIKTIQEKFPGNRYIVATSPNDLSCQQPLNLHSFALAGWTAKEKHSFIQKWSDMWQEHIISQTWASELPEIFDPIILKQWLIDDTEMSSPFAITLQTWAAYAGDSQGPGELAAIESYLARMTTGIFNARPALENLAAQSTLNAAPFMTRKQASAHIAAFETAANEEGEAEIQGSTEASPADDLADAVDVDDLLDDDELDALLDELDDLDDLPEDDAPAQEEASKKEGGKPIARTLLPLLTDAGILQANPNDTTSFAHIIIQGYLAGANLRSAEAISQLHNQPDWAGKQLAQLYLPVHKVDILPILGEAVQNAQKDPLQSDLITIASWLRFTPASTSWRNQLLRTLANTLKKDHLPIGMRARLMVALASSGEAGISKLFSQMLRSPQHNLRWLGALGCALAREKSAVDDLGMLAHDTSIFASRAACLALATIGTTRALEHLTSALLDGNDDVRRAAAEALALDEKEGHPVLKDGAEVEDVAVRRAVIFGLARVNEEWAQELLALKQVEDSEWIVRNAAVQIIEDMKLVEMTIPTDMGPLHETGWLIEFAGKKGMGMAAGQAAWDMLATALKEGDEETKLAAMHLFRKAPSEAYSVIEPLMEIMNGPEGEIREAAYHTLWQLKNTGIPLTE